MFWRLWPHNRKLAAQLRDVVQRSKAVKELQSKGGPTAVDILLDALEDPKVKGGYDIEEALGELRDQRAVQPLVRSILSGSGRFALDAILKIGHQAAVPPFLAALTSSDSRTRVQAAWALGEFSAHEATQPLVSLLVADSDCEVVHRAAMALQKLGWRPSSGEERTKYAVGTRNLDETAALGADAFELITAVFHGGQNSDAKTWAVRALSHIQPPQQRVADLLIEALRDKDKAIRYEAAAALAYFKESEVVNHLITALQKELEITVRVSIADSLGTLGDERAIPALIDAMRWKEPGWVQSAVKATKSALVKLGSPSLDPLLSVAKEAEGHFGDSVMDALGELGDRRAMPLLVDVLTNETTGSNKKSRAQTALEKLGWKPETPIARIALAISGRKYEEAAREGESAWVPLCEALVKEGASGRMGEFSKAFALIGAASPSRLLDGLKAEKDLVRACSAQAAGELKNRNMVPELGKILLRPDVGYDAAPCKFAATALAQIGDPECRALFNQAASSSTALVRYILATALRAQGNNFVDVLLKLLRDREGNVRYEAILSLAGGQGTSNALHNAASDSDLAVALAAADMLQTCGDARAGQLQRVALASVRSNAASYLIDVCDDLDSVHKSHYAVAKHIQPYYEARIKRVAEALNKFGGKPEMLRVGQQVAARSTHGRYLEGVWGGIGEWRG